MSKSRFNITNPIDSTLKKFQHQEVRRWVLSWAFLLPLIAVILTFRVAALIWNFYLSVHETTLIGGRTFVGLEHWSALIQDPVFHAALFNNFLFFLTIPVGIIIALAIALLLNQKFFGANSMRAIFFMPYIMMMVAVAVIWQYMFQTSSGVINTLLLNLGVIDSNIPWLSSSIWAKVSVFIVHIWKTVGFFMVIILAGLQTIPRQVYEVARVDGASKWQRFRYITLPLLRPTLAVCTLVGMVTTFKLFDLVTVLTGGGPGVSTEILLTFLYKEAMSYGHIGYGAAIAGAFWIVFNVVTLVLRTATSGVER
ncbi:carbohydrate ABC transporter permease [Haloferax sp. YSMS24]|uniref:carbohydrate ABC transporter permease n=1 Tax=Haloferax sp. YSMS24 TaxID=3388425 RepID=UPI00398CB628